VVRTVIVKSPSVWRETGGVIRAVLHIALWSAALMAATWGGTGAPDAIAKRTVAVDEVPFRELDADAQRMYRASLAGLVEAEDVRSQKGDWPTVEALAARRVPPFAPDPIDRAGYAWKILRDGPLVNYVGTPTDKARPTIAIVILEPDRGMAPDPTQVVDETHHRLRDNTLVHVSIWTGTKSLTSPASTPPFEDGWRRVTMN
jgi:hypothetical protein